MHSWLNTYQVQLSQQITAERLPHALLIKGIKGAGKTALSQWLVSVLLCQQKSFDSTQNRYMPCGTCKSCQLMRSETFPEHIAVAPEKNSLGVDAIRQATKFFEKKPQIGHVKAVEIHDAQWMTIAAANALLKTLEEPSAQSYIILISSDADRMLPTIISRCSVIDIRPPSGETLLAQLSSQALKDDFANLSHLPELTDAETAKSYQELTQIFHDFLKAPSQGSPLMSYLNSHEHGLRWLEKLVVTLYRQSFNWVSESQSAQVSSSILWDIYQSIVSSHKQLLTIMQANRQFMIEKLVTDIAELINNQAIISK